MWEFCARGAGVIPNQELAPSVATSTGCELHQFLGTGLGGDDEFGATSPSRLRNIADDRVIGIHTRATSQRRQGG